MGHLVSSEWVETIPAKLQVIKEWPTPKTIKQLRDFLGLTGSYRKFIPGYSRIYQPLYQLTKNDGFHWSKEYIAAFEQLKATMASPQVLALPYFTKTFEIECDTLGYGIGAVLQQVKRPITFTGQVLGPRNQALSAYEKELIAIVYAVKKW